MGQFSRYTPPVVIILLAVCPAFGENGGLGASTTAPASRTHPAASGQPIPQERASASEVNLAIEAAKSQLKAEWYEKQAEDIK